MRKFFRTALLLGIVFGLSACQGRQFEPYWLVNKLRVLGIQSDLPELRPGDTTNIFVQSSFLTIPSVTNGEWCPFDTQPGNGFECPLTQEELLETVPDDIPAGLIQFEDFDRGTDPEMTLPYPAPQPILAALCQGLQDALSGDDVPDEIAAALPSFNCADGLDVSVRLKVSDGEDEIIASKRINLWLESDQDQDVNPVVEEMQIRLNDPDKDRATVLAAGHDWASDNDWVTIDPENPTPVLVNIRYDVRTIVTPESVQTYARRAPDGSDLEFLDPEREIIEFQWFMDGGSVAGEAEKLFFEGTISLEDAGVSEFIIPDTDRSQEEESINGEVLLDRCPEITDNDDATGCEIRIWTVVRDDRFGMDFIERSLLVTGIAE